MSSLDAVVARLKILNNQPVPVGIGDQASHPEHFQTLRQRGATLDLLATAKEALAALTAERIPNAMPI